MQRLSLSGRLYSSHRRSSSHVKTGAGRHVEDQNQEVLRRGDTREILQGAKDAEEGSKKGHSLSIQVSALPANRRITRHSLLEASDSLEWKRGTLKTKGL